MNRAWFFKRLEGWGDREALVSNGRAVRYQELLEGVSRWRQTLADVGAGSGRVVAFDGDYSDSTVTLLLSLIERSCIAVPLASAAASQKEEFLALAQAEFLVECGEGRPVITPLDNRPTHPLLGQLAGTEHPGLVLFSSGSTGRPKAILHDGERLLEKFEPLRPGLRMLSFLLLDHIGGINTLLYALSTGGTVVAVSDRSPTAICQAIERDRVEVLPTSPTFLNLLLMSGEYRRHDLSSLRVITYGTEVMPAAHAPAASARRSRKSASSRLMGCRSWAFSGARAARMDRFGSRSAARATRPR